jgi:tetratricopeptide (TPR) repeat protein
MELKVLNCPMCGASVEPNQSKCTYCCASIIYHNTINDTNEVYHKLKEKSFKKYFKLLEENPDDIVSLINLSIIQLNENNFRQAKTLLEKALILEDKNPLINYLYGQTLWSGGKIFPDTSDYYQSIEYNDKAVELDPSFKEAVAFSHLFNAFRHKNDDSLFFDLIQKAFDILPDNFDIKLNYAIAIFNKRKMVEAECILVELLDKMNKKIGDPRVWYSFLVLSQIYYYNGAYDNALNAINEALNYTGPSIPNADLSNLHCFLGGYLWRLKKYDEALGAINKAINLFPQNPLAVNLLASTKGIFRRKKIILVHGQ